jgi:chromosome segregation ATPase
MEIVKEKLRDVQAAEVQSSALRDQLDEIEAQFQIIASQWLDKERQLQELVQVINHRDQKLLELAQVIEHRDQKLQEYVESFNVYRQRVAELEQHAVAREKLIDATGRQFQEACHQLEATAERLSAVERYARELVGSRAFKIGSLLTWPVRMLRHREWRRRSLRQLYVSGQR